MNNKFNWPIDMNVREKWTGEILIIYRGIDRGNIKLSLSLIKIEFILKKRPKEITQKMFNECITLFDEKYIIETIDNEINN